jgi:hypothetical protein
MKADEFVSTKPNETAGPLDTKILKEATEGDTTSKVPLTSALFIKKPFESIPISYCTRLVPAVQAKTTDPGIANSLLVTNTYLGPPVSQVAEDSAVNNK